MQMENEKVYRIFRAKTAGELHDKGFKIIRTETNKSLPWLKVFIFDDTPEFRKALTELSHKKESQNQKITKENEQ